MLIYLFYFKQQSLYVAKGRIGSMKQRKTVEDYLKAVYLLHKKNGSVRGVDIAAELHRIQRQAHTPERSA